MITLLGGWAGGINILVSASAKRSSKPSEFRVCACYAEGRSAAGSDSAAPSVEGVSAAAGVSAEGAGADGDVGILERDEQLVGFLDRGGKVGVGEQGDAAQRLEHAVADAVALAAIPAVGDEAEAVEFALPGGDDLGGIVFRSIVDHQDLDLEFRHPSLALHPVADALEGAREPLRLVVGGNHDA